MFFVCSFEITVNDFGGAVDLDLEYYREEPQGIRRILKAFSSFEKKGIGSDLFALAYHVILEEEKSKRERESLSCFMDDGLRLAGLK